MGGKSGSKGSTVTGYRYFFDILCGLARGPVDQLVAIRVGDVECWPGNADGTLPSSSVSDLVNLFNPGTAAPPGGYYDQSGGPLNTSADFIINKPELFGGDKSEGGIIGNATLMMGDKNQLIHPAIKTAIATGNSGFAYTYGEDGGVGTDVSGLDADGNQIVTGRDSSGNLQYQTDDGGVGSTVERAVDISEFRGLASLYYSGQVCSNNPYPKSWKFRLRRALSGWDKNGVWYELKAIIPLQKGNVRAMNPAHMIYQCLTDTTWGRGLPRSEIDDMSFVYAANYLYDEGLGLSLKWSKEMDISEFMQTVVNHISAVIAVDRVSGLITLRLIRDDYDASAVPEFSFDTGLLSIEGDDSSSPAVLVNEVVIKWHDPVQDKDRQRRVQNLAAIQASGAIISETKDYPGICDTDVAARIGLRDLRLYSGALKKFKVTLDRRAWKMVPGSVFAVVAPDRGISRMVVRVLTYDDGTMIDGKITIECAQDVFSMPSTIYTDNVFARSLSPTTTSASVPVTQIAYEASYYDMQRGLTETSRSEITSDEGGVVVVAGSPTSVSTTALVYSGADGETKTATDVATFSPTAVIAEALGYHTTSCTMLAGSDLGKVKVGTLAIITGCYEGDDSQTAKDFRARGELVRIDAIDTVAGALTLGRGCVDTIPKVHLAKSRIYFHDVTASGSTAVYTAGETVSASLLTQTGHDTLDPAQAKTSTVTVTGRWAKPYPPGQVKINGHDGQTKQDNPVFVSGDCKLTWASRNKVIQADQLIDTTQNSITPEAGTTYSVQVWSSGYYQTNGTTFIPGTFLREYSGITDTAFTYTTADAEAHGDPTNIDIVLFTVVNTVASLEVYTLHIVKVAEGAGGYGDTYNYGYSQPPPS